MEENITQETNDLTGNDNSSSASKKSEAAPSKEERDTSPVTTVTETTTEKQSFERVYPLHREDSYFDGTSLQLIGWKFLGCLVSLFSFGLCTPWAFTMIYSWEAKHTYIEGRQLHFDGHAGELFGRWILWFLGSIGILTLFGMLELGIIWWSNGVIFHPEHYYLFPTPYLAFFVVYLLLIISLILYGTWVEVSLWKWKVSHTHFA